MYLAGSVVSVVRQAEQILTHVEYNKEGRSAKLTIYPHLVFFWRAQRHVFLYFFSNIIIRRSTFYVKCVSVREEQDNAYPEHT